MTETGSNSLADLRLPELKKMAAGMGIKGTSVMRKGDLIAAISGGVNVSARADAPTRAARTRKKTESEPQLPVEAPENPGSGNVRDNARTEAEPEAPQTQQRSEGEGMSRNRRRRERNKERDRATQEATNEEVGERLAAALGQAGGSSTAQVLAPTNSGASPPSLRTMYSRQSLGSSTSSTTMRSCAPPGTYPARMMPTCRWRWYVVSVCAAAM